MKPESIERAARAYAFATKQAASDVASSPEEADAIIQRVAELLKGEKDNGTATAA